VPNASVENKAGQDYSKREIHSYLSQTRVTSW